MATAASLPYSSRSKIEQENDALAVWPHVPLVDLAGLVESDSVRYSFGTTVLRCSGVSEASRGPIARIFVTGTEGSGELRASGPHVHRAAAAPIPAARRLGRRARTVPGLVPAARRVGAVADAGTAAAPAPVPAARRQLLPPLPEPQPRWRRFRPRAAHRLARHTARAG
jgi:hypothetical protein